MLLILKVSFSLPLLPSFPLSSFLFISLHSCSLFIPLRSSLPFPPSLFSLLIFFVPFSPFSPLPSPPLPSLYPRHCISDPLSVSFVSFRVSLHFPFLVVSLSLSLPLSFAFLVVPTALTEQPSLLPPV